MVTILGDEVVGVAIVIDGVELHELSDLDWVQAGGAHENRFPELESRALTRVDFEDAARRVIVSSKRVLHSVY